jgi:NADH dehydrogenase
MKVLVTGGTGVVGEAAVTALAARGHEVRLLSRGAQEARRQWPGGVASRAADVSRPDGLAGTAEGCDAVLHVAGIVRESGEQTFEAVNVQGTRALLREAERAGVRRFVFVSSLGADRGSSAYHLSKRAAEDLVRRFAAEWVIVRPGNVYGPGDEVVSQLLKMTRALPAVPLVDDGEQPFQAIWHEDLGLALALAVERDDVAGQVLEVAGPQVTSMSDLVSRLAALDDRFPVRVPVPAALVRTAARAAAWLNLPFPVDDNKLAMLEEENVVRGENALLSTLGLTATPLDEGLRRLVASLPEQTAAGGVGRLQRKRFWAVIEGSDLTPAQLRAVFLEHMGRLLPLEGGPPEGTKPRVGSVFTLELPLRGVIEMRFAESKPSRLVFLTLAGHPLAGALLFHFGRGPRFEVETLIRPATLADAMGLAAGGGLLQDATWRETVARVVDMSGGRARGGVQQESSEPDEAEVEEIERWMDELVTARKRAEHARVGPEGPAASRPRGLGGERPVRDGRRGKGRAPARARAGRRASPASGRTGRPRRSSRASSR